MEAFFQAVFLCRKAKPKDLEKETNIGIEKIKIGASGIDNNGMEKENVEAKEENEGQEYTSDPKKCSQDPHQVKVSVSIPQRSSEESNPDPGVVGGRGGGGGVVGGLGGGDGGVVGGRGGGDCDVVGGRAKSNVHKLLCARYAALGPLSFKEQQVTLFSDVLKVEYGN